MIVLRKIFEFFVDTFQSLLLAASVFLVVYVFLFRPYQVSGSSMYPTFINKEYILTNLIVLRVGEIKRGDVVVFKSTEDPQKDFIKRVIGIEGDSVMVKEGDVYVNDSRLDESAYLSDDIKTYSGIFLQEAQPVTVPAGSYFVLGDNRTNSSDSRQWGFVKKDAIIGKSLFVYWPPDKSRVVKNPFGQ